MPYYFPPSESPSPLYRMVTLLRRISLISSSVRLCLTKARRKLITVFSVKNTKHFIRWHHVGRNTQPQERSIVPFAFNKIKNNWHDHFKASDKSNFILLQQVCDIVKFKFSTLIFGEQAIQLLFKLIELRLLFFDLLVM